MPETPPERPLRKGERTRLHIMRVATQLFSSQPPSSIKMDDIAYAAKVSVGTLYNYFPSRDALLLAFTTEAYDVLERYRADVSKLPSPLQRVYAAGDAYLQFAIERPAFVRYMIAQGLQPVEDEELAEMNERASRRVRELVMQAAIDLREAMQAGEMPAAPVDELVVMLFGMWNGIVGLVVRADETRIPPELAQRAVARSRELLHRAILHEFANSGPPPAPWEREAPPT
ncbi:MAG: TetR/AcrR family transcriptional regulator [Patulibacter sp.]